ncbi:hypothetical protein F4802DRAFT_225618 [Xylaria palmicola]|nr:hypothetical protein F4802DRAFT_225618 [Xylaria palmicola]
MLLRILSVLGVLALGITAEVRREETQSLYGQCGGLSYTGPTRCPKTATCYNDGTNPWYSQCVETPWDNGGQPTSTVATTTKTSKSTTTTKTTTTSKTTTISKTTTTSKSTKTSKSTTTSGSVITIITTLPVPTTTTVTLWPDDPFTEDRARQELGDAHRTSPLPDDGPASEPRSEQ